MRAALQECLGVLAAQRRVRSTFFFAGCEPPEAFILHREIVLTIKASFTLRTYLMIKITRIAR